MKDTKVLDLYGVASDVDIARTELEEALAAMQLLYEVLGEEGYQVEGQFEEWKAINFVRRFPMHLSAFAVILRGLWDTTTKLKSASDRAYDAYKAQKEATK